MAPCWMTTKASLVGTHKSGLKCGGDEAMMSDCLHDGQVGEHTRSVGLAMLRIALRDMRLDDVTGSLELVEMSEQRRHVC